MDVRIYLTTSSSTHLPKKPKEDDMAKRRNTTPIGLAGASILAVILLAVIYAVAFTNLLPDYLYELGPAEIRSSIYYQQHHEGANNS